MLESPPVQLNYNSSTKTSDQNRSGLHATKTMVSTSNTRLVLLHTLNLVAKESDGNLRHILFIIAETFGNHSRNCDFVPQPFRKVPWATVHIKTTTACTFPPKKCLSITVTTDASEGCLHLSYMQHVVLTAMLAFVLNRSTHTLRRT